MFHKFINEYQGQLNCNAEYNNNKSEQERLWWQHKQMIRQDLQGLFYRKLNYIVMLQQSEQAYHQREILMISHREPHQNPNQNQSLNIHPVTFLAKTMVNQNEKLRKQLQIRKKEAQAKIQLCKLQTDRKCLIAQITIYVNKLKEIAQEHYIQFQLKQAEKNFLQVGKKHNLLTPIVSFIQSVKEITKKNIIVDYLKNSLKRNNLQQSRSLRIQDLNLSLNQSNKKELLDHITLYLKQFKSSAIFKEISHLLSHFMQLYDQINLHSHYLYNKIVSEIDNNLAALAKINQSIHQIANQLKDFIIEIQILTQQSKAIKEQIKLLEQKSSECISDEANYLCKEYHSSKNYEFDEQFGEELDFYAYFHDKLRTKYQQFIKNQLQDAEHIYLLKQKIEHQAKYLSQFQKQFTMHEPSMCSELMTHRSIQQSTYSQYKCPLNQLKVSKNEQIYCSRKSTQSVIKKSLLRERIDQCKQKFHVKKQLKIRYNSKSIASKPKENDKVYELKVAKKYLILQQTTPYCLRINEKIQIQHIKGYNLQGDHCVIIHCGTNSLRLSFLSSNKDRFIKLMQEALKELKKGKAK